MSPLRAGQGCLLLALALCGCSTEAEPLGGASARGPAIAWSVPEREAQGVLRRARIELAVDTYLDPEPLRDANPLLLSSGARRLRGTQYWDPVRRALILIPGTLEPYLQYRLTISAPELLRDLDGRAVEVPEGWELDFSTGPDRGERPYRWGAPELTPWLQETLEARCQPCHGASARGPGQPDLGEVAALEGQPARGWADRVLVRGGFASESYLLHKVLPNYPDRGGERMPRESPALPPEDLERLYWSLQRRAW